MDFSILPQRTKNLRLLRSRRFVLVFLIALLSLSLTTGCQITYLVSSGYHQARLLSSRVPIEKALNDPNLTSEEKRKLKLAQEARVFAETELGLKPTRNYTSYVHLDRPYVTYVVSAAEKSALKPYNWWFPLVGSLPYKGFFTEEAAKNEAKRMSDKGYDVYVRGVSAYSTLGWFNDPILSSMLRYKDYDLVDTIIHETVHATIYIKSEADFNERLAVFFGAKGAEEFYRKREGENGQTIQAMADDLHDSKLFSDFIAAEMKELESWYAAKEKEMGKEKKQNGTIELNEKERKARLRLIQDHFVAQLKPKLKRPEYYKSFETSELNNARLLNFRLYFENLDDFERLFVKLGRDYKKMLKFCKSLEDSKDPKADLAKASQLPTPTQDPAK